MGRKSVPYPFQIHFRDTLSILHYTKFLTVPNSSYVSFLLRNLPLISLTCNLMKMAKHNIATTTITKVAI
ncbi:hypothetical protein CV944_16505 [Geobacillus sp. WSUCF-018B]|nr:hypothetical protein CV944_16505 [Geobacillus sp. WSUCF-018B]